MIRLFLGRMATNVAAGGGTPPAPYIPALKFNDKRNSMYLFLLIL